MHGLEHVAIGERRIIVVQHHIQTTGDQPVVDCVQAGGLLRMVVPHIVKQAIGVRDVGNGHVVPSNGRWVLQAPLLQCNNHTVT